MKVLYIFRDSYDAKYILSHLDKKGVVQGIILESGKLAKKKKLFRMFKKSSLLQYPNRILDLFALTLYSSYVSHKIESSLGHYDYPQKKVLLTIDDVNEEKCIDAVKNFKPDLVIIFGTAIVKKDFLRKVKSPVINIHTGILPNYRNVHSEFWALRHRDFDNIGVSIIVVDEGVDTGDVVLKRHIKFDQNDSIVSVKVKNLKMIDKMLIEVLKEYGAGNLRRTKQKSHSASTFPTPGWWDLVQFFIRK